MRYAVMSDIHANAIALARVLGEARRAGAEVLILLGDYVGYYYEPQAVIDMIGEWPHHAIRGNHDTMLLAARANPTIADEARVMYGSSIDTALSELNDAAWMWLSELKDSETLLIGSQRITLAHGAPFDPDFYVYPDAKANVFARCASGSEDAVWMGHTHWPFVRPGSPWLMNPGSVGQPRDIGGLASWCLFDASTGAISMRRTEIDVEMLAREVMVRDPLLPRNADILSRGRLSA